MLRRHGASALCLGLLLAGGIMAQGKRQAADSPDQKEIHDYVLTMDKVQKWGNATKQLQDLAKQHPELNNNNNSDAKDLSEMTQKLQKYPEVVALLSKNGLTPREYCLSTMTIMQVGIAVGFKKSGTYKDYPPDMLKLVSKDNLDFAEKHWDEIMKYSNSGKDDK